MGYLALALALCGAAAVILRDWWRHDAPVGTKSVLAGYHAFWLHPFIVARAWHRLYGWGSVRYVYGAHLTEVRRRAGATGMLIGHLEHTDLVLTTSLRDWRLWLAFVVHDLGYWGRPNMDGAEGEEHPYWGARVMKRMAGPGWYSFTLFHSRFLAKRLGGTPSPLCMADKTAILLYPDRLYFALTAHTGELREYMALARRQDREAWLRDVKAYVAEWVAAHRNGAPDTWTGAHGVTQTPGDTRPVVTETGVHA